MAANGPDVRLFIGPPDNPKAVEIRMDPTFHRDKGRWLRRFQKVDHRDDDYHKVIFDPATGEVLYEQREPLRDHQGRGDARRPRPS